MGEGFRDLELRLLGSRDLSPTMQGFGVLGLECMVWR